jgi:hypothetical protein
MRVLSRADNAGAYFATSLSNGAMPVMLATNSGVRPWRVPM